MRRIFLLLAALLLAHPALGMSNPRKLVLRDPPTWSLPNASADMFFALNAGSCEVGGRPVACTSQISTIRAQTVLSYAQWADGHLSSFAANTPRITDQGLLVEQASTNQALWARDMTNAAWVKVSMTAALTATGADNTANAASTLTATGANGTILQTLMITSQPETYSVYCKRISGTGTVNITENGGTAWTPIALTSAYQRFNVEATLANPIIGLQITTNGDSIACDFNQDEELAFATSPIPTTSSTVTRAADNITAAGALLTAILNAKAARFVTNGLTVSTGNAVVVGFGGGAQLLLPNSGGSVAVASGAGTATGVLGSGTRAGLVKGAFGMDSASYTAIGNGGAKGTVSSAFTENTGTVNIGSAGGTSSFLNGNLLRMSFGPTKGMFDATTTGSNPQ